MNVAVGDEDYDTGRVARINSAFARMTHKDLGHPVQTLDASPFRLSMLQQDDPILSLIIADKNIPRSTFHLPTFGKSEHSRLPATIINNVLYVKQLPQKGFLQTSDLRMAVPRSMPDEILLEAHNSLIGGHGGQFKTTECLHNKFWWPSMADDIAKHISGCVTCQASTTRHHSDTAPLVPLPAPRGCGERVHCDLFGPVATSCQKNNYILVITDSFSKHATATAIPGKEATNVAPAILAHFYTFGVPQLLLTDGGREFRNSLQKQIWEALGIRQDVTTPYHPQCNAQVEVWNKNLKHYLATAILDAEKSTLDWESYLGPLMFSYNTAIHSATQLTPFETVFGYDPRVPLWEGKQYPGDKQVQKASFAEYLANLRHTQLRARQIAYHNNQHYRDQYKESYDRRHDAKYPAFLPGDKVWVRIMDKQMPNPKLSPSWERATILSHASNGTAYKINRPGRKRGKNLTVNIQQLKPDRQEVNKPKDSGDDGLFSDDSSLPHAPQQERGRIRRHSDSDSDDRALHIRRKHDNDAADDLNNEMFLHNMLDRLSALKDQPPAPRPAEYVNPAGPQDYEDSVHSDKSASFQGFDSVNDKDFHGFNSNHDSDSYYDPERPMFPRDNRDLDYPATDADDESDHVPTHCPDCQPCKLHSRKRLHGSDKDDPSKRHKGRIGWRRLHVPLERGDNDLGRRGNIRTHSNSDEKIQKI
jgi:hypothetical protein